MEELITLAKKLGQMGIFDATFNPDLNEYMQLKKSSDDFNALPSTVWYNKPVSEIKDVLAFTMQIYGVKMTFKCRNARLETDERLKSQFTKKEANGMTYHMMKPPID